MCSLHLMPFLSFWAELFKFPRENANILAKDIFFKLTCKQIKTWKEKLQFVSVSHIRNKNGRHWPCSQALNLTRLLILVSTTNMKRTIVRNSLDREKKLIKKTNIMSTLVSCHVIDKSDVSGSTGCVYLIFQFYNV